MKVLIGQRHIDHQLRLESIDKPHQFRNIVRIHPGGLDGARQSGRNFFALGKGPAGQTDIGKHLRSLGALVGHHLPDATCADDKYFCHNVIPSCIC